jgi:alcohol dehydrogenase (cytochrome c)
VLRIKPLRRLHCCVSASCGYGEGDRWVGEFIALDQDTGQTLWKFKTGLAINSPPITYTHQRRQFVTVLSGVGGAVNRRMKGYDLIPTGGSVTTFALMPD